MELKYKNRMISFNIMENQAGYTLSSGELQKEFRTAAISPNSVCVDAGGRKFIAYFEEDRNHYYIWIEGRQIVFDKVTEEEKSFGGDGSVTGDIQSVYPPMPGSVVKILAEEGSAVKEGDPLLIFEAMKMEMTIYAVIDGTVSLINAKQGEQVNTDRILMKIEK